MQVGWRRAAVGTFGRRLARHSVSATDLTRPDRANGLESSPGECWSDWGFADRLQGGPGLPREHLHFWLVRGSRGGYWIAALETAR